MASFGEVSLIEAAGGSLQDLAAKYQEEHRVLYIDCCNSFDPYRLYRLAGCGEALERVLVARPFTLYQLRELVLNKLERMVQSSGARVVLVAGVGYFRMDEPIEADEFSAIWGGVWERLKTLSRDYKLLTLVSEGGGSDGPDGQDRVDADI
jgi:hypothetical protein